MHANPTQSVATSPSKACLAAETLLELWIGLDPHTVGRNAIARAVRVRMEACGESDEDAFIARLTHDATQQGRLIEEVVVPESWFFRDAHAFDFLRRFATAYATTPGRAPLRILCVPCAAGEEPYSVAITLLEAGLSAHQFRIDAYDVSQIALARAAAATYSANAFRGGDLAFRDRWFRVRGAAVELDEAVRQQVHFSWGNLLDESFAADLQPYDIIFCRNLLIYLTSDARSRVEQTLDQLLAPDGLLMLGAVETLILKGPWLPVAETAGFAMQRGTRATNRFPAPPPVPWPTGPAPLIRGRLDHLPADTLASVNSSGHSSGNSSGHASGHAGAAEPVVSRPPTGDELLREAHSLANAGRHDEALQACQRHQQAAGPSAHVFFLMGTLHQAAGELERAEACLHKTLYLDPAHDEAFLSLALVATQRGDDQMAEHYRQSAARVRSRKGPS